MQTLYLSVGVSGPGGVEVEAERGGRGGFSSSPSTNHRKGELTCDGKSLNVLVWALEIPE